MTEKQVQLALASKYRWYQNKVFINSHICGGEMDFAVVTQSLYLWEFEIKLSIQDWKRDEKKYKWNHPDRKFIKRFYYVVPYSMILKKPEFVSDDYGLIGIEQYTDELRLSVVREAKSKKVKPIPEKMVLQFMGKMYWKFWHDKYRDAEIETRVI